MNDLASIMAQATGAFRGGDFARARDIAQRAALSQPANAQVLQSSRVAERLQYLDVLVQDAESSMRGYFISGNEVYLGPTRSVFAA